MASSHVVTFFIAWLIDIVAFEGRSAIANVCKRFLCQILVQIVPKSQIQDPTNNSLNPETRTILYIASGIRNVESWFLALVCTTVCNCLSWMFPWLLEFILSTLYRYVYYIYGTLQEKHKHTKYHLEKITYGGTIYAYISLIWYDVIWSIYMYVYSWCPPKTYVHLTFAGICNIVCLFLVAFWSLVFLGYRIYIYIYLCT